MKNITENNILLAEFLGAKLKGESNFFTLKEQEIWIPEFGICHLGNSGKILKFHNDWNWIMLVVDKIINLKGVYAEERQKVYTTISPKIEVTYNACVEFVKWYNSQSK